MRITNVRIEGFRSIKNCQLEECGPFNVLIGQNSTGKSNILLAVRSFFAMLTRGHIATPNPDLGRETDFHGMRPAGNQIGIEISFSLEGPESFWLYELLPNPMEASADVDPEELPTRLSVKLVVSYYPNSIGYVSSITVSSGEGRVKEKKLFGIPDSDNAVRSLAARCDQAVPFLRDAEVLRESTKRINEGQWEALKPLLNPKGDSGRLKTFIDIRVEALNKLRALSQDAVQRNSFPKFVDTLTKLATESEASYNKLLSAPFNIEVMTAEGDAKEIPTYVIEVVKLLARMEVVHIPDVRGTLSSAEADDLLLRKVRRPTREGYRILQRKFSALLGGTLDVAAGQDSQGIRLGSGTAEVDIDDYPLDLQGAGSREVVRIIHDIAQVDVPDILLLEEPETHLHPGLERRMLQYLKELSEECQVFVSTHSTGFVEGGEMENVYLVSCRPDTKAVRPDLENAATLVLRELGIRPSSVLMYDRLVFVEGPTDRDVLSQWASVVGADFRKANVGFIEMGGSGNFAYYAAERVLAYLSKRNVRMWIVLDSDEQSEDAILKAQERAGTSATVHVLTKREIENYMLIPRAISDFVVRKRRVAGKGSSEPPGTQNITQAIVQAADELRNYTVAKRVADRIGKIRYPRPKLDDASAPTTVMKTTIKTHIEGKLDELKKAAAGLDVLFSDEERQLGAVWDESKLNRVPGTELLNGVCSRYDVRFHKAKDSLRLATIMTKSEIDSEIAKLLQEVARPD